MHAVLDESNTSQRLKGPTVGVGFLGRGKLAPSPPAEGPAGTLQAPPAGFEA